MITTLLTYTTLNCYRCGVPFALEDGYHNSRLADGRSFYCPNGHSQHFTESGAKRLRKAQEALDRARAHAKHLEDQKDAADRSNRALRGHLTRTRKRLAGGVCPCCKRSFAVLAKHMATQHPSYGRERE